MSTFIIDKRTGKKGYIGYCLKPSNLNLHAHIQLYPPSIVDFDIYAVNYILHLIITLPAFRDEKDMLGLKWYVPLNAKKLQSAIPKYREYLDYLLESGVLVSDGQYIVGEKSIGYQLSSVYLESGLVKDYMFEWKFGERLEGADYHATDERATQDLFYLQKWFNEGLTIDDDAAICTLEKLKVQELSYDDSTAANARFNARFFPLYKIVLRDFYFFVDRTAGRLHTPLVSLKKELRQHIRYASKPLVSIDIVNSQPFLCLALLDHNLFKNLGMAARILVHNPGLESAGRSFEETMTAQIQSIQHEPDVAKFKEWVVSGTFYEEFGRELVANGVLENDPSMRRHAKTATFGALFAPNSSIGSKPEMQYFRQVFPNVYQVFSSIKRGSGGVNRALACCLQNLEAELILRDICGLVSRQNPDLPLFTIHDSVVTETGSEAKIVKVFEDIFILKMQKKPKLLIENW